jgi:hypothetical protein
MTEQTKSIETLKAEVEALKAQKLEELKAQAEQRKQDEEEAELKRQLNDLKEGRLPGETTASAEGTTGRPASSRTEQIKDLETARVRLWAYGLGAYLTGPIFPGIIAARTKEWMPFWIGLGAGVICLPFAAVDLGLLSSVPAAGVAVAAQASKTNKKRQQYGVMMPAQADSKMMKLMDF